MFAKENVPGDVERGLAAEVVAAGAGAGVALTGEADSLGVMILALLGDAGSV